MEPRDGRPLIRIARAIQTRAKGIRTRPIESSVARPTNNVDMPQNQAIGPRAARGATNIIPGPAAVTPTQTVRKRAAPLSMLLPA